MVDSADLGFADADEGARALAEMSDADLLRLKRFAQHRAAGLPGIEWEDLFHDAVDRVLSGRRRWPRSVPFIVFLQQTVRSLSHEHWRRRLEGPLVSEADLDLAQRAEHQDAPDMGARSPEAQLEARDLLRAVVALFESDALIIAVLTGLADGQTPTEIIRSANCTPVAFASARRRIRRTLEKAAADGRLPNAEL